MFLRNFGLFTVINGSLVIDGNGDGGLGDRAVRHCFRDHLRIGGRRLIIVFVVAQVRFGAEGVGDSDGLASTHVGIIIGGRNIRNFDSFAIHAAGRISRHLPVSVNCAIIGLGRGDRAVDGQGGGVDGDGDGAIAHNGGVVLRRDLIPVLAAFGHIDKRDCGPALSVRLGLGIMLFVLLDKLYARDSNGLIASSSLGRPAGCYIVSFTSIGAGVILCSNHHFRRGDFQGCLRREIKFIVAIVPSGRCLQRSGDGVAAHGCVICIRSGIHRRVGIVHIGGR